MISHDQNFKNIIVDYTVQSIEACAREEFDAMPPGAVFTPIRQEQLKEMLGDSFHELDVPILATFPDKSCEALIFIFENESTDRGEFLHYLATVTLKISQMMKTKRVVPIAVHPFRKKPLETELKIGGNTQCFLKFNCLSCVFGTMNARDYEHSTNIVERLCLPLMEHADEDRLLIVHRAYEGLRALEPDPEKRKKYGGFISYYSELKEQEKPEFYEKYVRHSSYMEDVMTLNQLWQNEGIAIGEARGEARGVRGVILRHGTRQFGPPDEKTRAMLDAMDSLEQLEILADRVAFVSNWDELMQPAP